MPDARTILAMRYRMQYTIKWRDYYKQQKTKKYHQETKGKYSKCSANGMDTGRFNYDTTIPKI